MQKYYSLDKCYVINYITKGNQFDKIAEEYHSDTWNTTVNVCECIKNCFEI